MGSLRPRGSPNLEDLLVAFAVVIVKQLSNMSCVPFGMQVQIYKYFSKYDK